MEVRVEEISTLTKKVVVTLPEDDVQPKLNQAYEKLQKRYQDQGLQAWKGARIRSLSRATNLR